MCARLYVGNLHPDIDRPQLEQLFAAYGSVRSAEVVTDPGTGQSMGFGFVEIERDEDARAAIDRLDGSEFSGRSLVVRLAGADEPTPAQLTPAAGPKRGGFGDRGGRRAIWGRSS